VASRPVASERAITSESPQVVEASLASQRAAFVLRSANPPELPKRQSRILSSRHGSIILASRPGEHRGSAGTNPDQFRTRHDCRPQALAILNSVTGLVSLASPPGRERRGRPDDSDSWLLDQGPLTTSAARSEGDSVPVTDIRCPDTESSLHIQRCGLTARPGIASASCLVLRAPWACRSNLGCLSMLISLSPMDSSS